MEPGGSVPDPLNIALESPRVIFMLTPKAANTSVVQAVGDALGIPGRADLALPTVDKAEAVRRKSYGWLVVAFVRHPVDRLISCWRDKVSEPGRFHEPFLRKYGTAVRPGMPFGDFAEMVCATPDEEADQHFRSQAHELMIGPEAAFGDLVRFEDLAQGWNRVCREIARRGLVLGVLPHANRSRAKRPAVPGPLREKIMRRYQQDYSVFNYA